MEKKINILLLDDNEAIRRLHFRMIECLRIPHELFSVGSVKEAKELIEKQHFDGAILDLILPDGSGLEVANVCAEKKIPVVFATGAEDEYNDLLMLDLGWILRKPVTLTALRRALTYFSNYEENIA